MINISLFRKHILAGVDRTGIESSKDAVIDGSFSDFI